MKLREYMAEKSGRLKREIAALHYACRDPETGVLPKLVILLTIAYALSPVDIIPDFIPVLGYLDDIVIIPALVYLSVRMIPADVMTRARLAAEERPPLLKKRWLFPFLIIPVWLALILILIRFIKQRF